MDARIRSHFRTNAKVASLSLEAKGLWLEGLLYACANDTGGLVPAGIVPNAGPIAQALVERNLWHPDDAGWRIHDFYEWNPAPDRREQLCQAVARAAELGALSPDYQRQITSEHIESDITPEEVESITRFILASWATSDKTMIGLPKFNTIMATRALWKARKHAPVSAAAYLIGKASNHEPRRDDESPRRPVHTLEVKRLPRATGT